MLNIRSCYSIPKSVIRIDELANACSDAGFSYVSICDDDLFGLPELLRVAKKHHLKAVFGYQLVFLSFSKPVCVCIIRNL